MAPKRGGGSSGDGPGGGSSIALEKTITLFLDPDYRTTFTACAIIGAIFTAAFLVIFSTNVFIRYRAQWKNVTESFFIWSMMVSALFKFVGYSLTFTAYLCTILEATVFESWALMGPWTQTFFLFAEFTLLAAMCAILHNRMRTVAINKSNATMVSVLNWILYAIYVVLSVVSLGDLWTYSALLLKDIKTGGSSGWDFMESEFHFVHARRISAAMVVLRFAIQLWIIVLGCIVLAKHRTGAVSEHARKAMKVFVFGSLVPYTIMPLVTIIIIFKYWEPAILYPRWLNPFQLCLEGIVLVVSSSSLCIFALMMAPKRAPHQWDFGTRRYAKGYSGSIAAGGK